MRSSSGGPNESFKASHSCQQGSTYFAQVGCIGFWVVGHINTLYKIRTILYQVKRSYQKLERAARRRRFFDHRPFSFLLLRRRTLRMAYRVSRAGIKSIFVHVTYFFRNSRDLQTSAGRHSSACSEINTRCPQLIERKLPRTYSMSSSST